ncbi:asparaginase [Paenibacillus sp. LHD-38]|uniref:asparaginase n=1 Tax=Paenibacillus sp. LHD-38 TaxID=3072143 RepID=UPI00280E094B|nr:asparaginase [Paenibacillus sp. LHD-38]MDQ8734509.1 asparaginase [Paenibacillus sp. LHD-38]
MAERLVEEYRGQILENIHYGHICGIDDTGKVILSAGNPEWVSYMRSAAKPFQAIPAFVHGIGSAFGLTDQEMTLMTASHRAESIHVEALESMLRKIGVSEESLVCSNTYPLSMQARDELMLGRKPGRRIYHNCSGKHLGVLALCKALGYGTEGYEDPAHPAQREIMRAVSLFSGCKEDEIKIGTDGCGFPVFALPLNKIAMMFLKLACPDLIENQEVRNAASDISRIMNAHHDMVSAPWFICSNLLKDPNIAAKGGAKGIYGFALRKERIAFALKVLDGSEDEWPLIIASILEQINYGNKETIERMYGLASREIKNDSNLVVGSNKAVFRLKSQSRPDTGGDLNAS